MQEADHIIEAGWIVPVRPAGQILEQHCLVIKDEQIAAILPTAEAKQQWTTKHWHQRQQHALFPGFVNAHTHIPMNLFRGYADDVPFMDWWQKYLFPAEQQFVDHDFVQLGSRLAIAEMLRAGITCFNDMYFFPKATVEEVLSSGIRANIGFTIMEFPTKWAADADEYLTKAEQIIKEAEHPRVNYLLAPHAPYSVSDETFHKVRKLADQLQLLINIHLHETDTEVKESLEKFGKRPLARLAELGFLQDIIGVHLVHVDADDIAALQNYGCHAVHCPESNMKLGSGICPAQKLIDAGINVALGTDGAASNNDLDMIGEMRSASLLAKVHKGQAEVLGAKTCLEMATINGATALGLADQIGSLEVGKQADVIALSFAELESWPLYDPISHLVYASDRKQISDVWIAGKQLLRERELLTIDVADLNTQTKKWQQQLTNFKA